ncbi:MAG: hypothetical protein ACJ72M_04025 [Propionibacteriaceae bacterium]
MSVLSSARRGVVRHPVVTFMLISLGAYFVTAAIPPIVNSEVLPFGLPLHGVVGGVLGVGLAAFLVTAALSGCAGVADLVRRSVRWRVSVRWYLIALLTVPVGRGLSRWRSTARVLWLCRLVAGRGRLRRSPPCLCCNWCCSNLPRRSDSPVSFSITGRTGITP